MAKKQDLIDFKTVTNGVNYYGCVELKNYIIRNGVFCTSELHYINCMDKIVVKDKMIYNLHVNTPLSKITKFNSAKYSILLEVRDYLRSKEVKTLIGDELVDSTTVVAPIIGSILLSAENISDIKTYLNHFANIYPDKTFIVLNAYRSGAKLKKAKSTFDLNLANERKYFADRVSGIFYNEEESNYYMGN